MSNAQPNAFDGAEIAAFVLGAPANSFRALGGLDAASLRAALDRQEPEPLGRSALSLPLAPCRSSEALVESVLAALADVAQSLWPLWWGVEMPERDDALGRAAAGIAARTARAFPRPGRKRPRGWP